MEKSEGSGEWWRRVEIVENGGRSGEQQKEWRTVEEVENGGVVNSGDSREW